ncbi:MAG: Do family serine endopeptidase [Hyphomicrobiaceae bacterium]
MSLEIPHALAPLAAAWPRRSLMQKLLIGTCAAALIAGASQLRTLATTTVHAATITTVNQPAAPGFADLVQRVKPAVVSVQVKMKTGAMTETGMDGSNPFYGQNPFEGTPFEKFFKKFGAPNGDQFDRRRKGGQEGGDGPVAQALGSGFFVSADGYVVTNNHVVDGAVEVKIVTDDGKTFNAKIVGTDSRTDLALLKVDGQSDLPFVHLAAEKPRVGDWVVAMGNPFGLGGTVTAGIVSAEGRDIGAGPYDDFIQIDAPVNKGNSGGPTFNLDGEVVGVNTAIFSPSGGSVGIAFDIPSETVQNVVAELKVNRKVERAWLGVEIQPVTADIAESLSLDSPKGALVSTLQPDSPATKAGLKSGDVIAKVDGQEVKDARDLARRIGRLHPGATVEIGYFRDGKPLTVSLALGELKDKTADRAQPASDESGTLDGLGMSVAPASTVAGSGEVGVVVTGLDANGAAAQAGLAEGDVLVNVAGKAVASAGDIEKALEAAKSAGKTRALALVKHGEDQHYVPLPVTIG